MTINLTRCPQCQKMYVPDLSFAELEKGRLEGKLIQDIFPQATPTQREQLQTGICSDECWNKYLGMPNDADGNGVEDEAPDAGDGTEPETL